MKKYKSKSGQQIFTVENTVVENNTEYVIISVFDILKQKHNRYVIPVKHFCKLNLVEIY